MQIIPINIGPATQTSGTSNTTASVITNLVSGYVYLLFVNTSSVDMYLGVSGTTPTINSGILVKANGGSLELKDYIPTGNVSVISISGSGNGYTLVVA